MALEIKELSIRVRVGGDDAPPVLRDGTDAGRGEPVDPSKVVEDSVRQVLEALRDLEER
jgi:hypothetical protein